MSRVVVLGIGNLLLGDEGVGVHAVKGLIQRYDLDGDVEVIDGGTSGMELLPELEKVDYLIVIDALRIGKPPATVVRLEKDQVPAFFNTKLSPHQTGLSDVLAALAFKGAAPGHVVLIGMQPVALAPGMELSPAADARLDEVVRLVVAELAASGHPARLRA